MSPPCQQLSNIISSPHLWKKYSFKNWGEDLIPNEFEINQQSINLAEYFVPILPVKGFG
jgi:hypothetical protein